MTATASAEAVGAMSVALGRTARDDSELLAALADDENLIVIFAALPGLQRPIAMAGLRSAEGGSGGA
jgi:hypothetical protein